MTQLAQQKCEACRSDAATVTDAEKSVLAPQIPQWQIKPADGIEQLVRQYKFDDFKKALAFTNKVGDLAEEEGHHPALLTEWGKVQVRWWTHKIRGLHVNDFIMAAKTDRLYASMS